MRLALPLALLVIAAGCTKPADPPRPPNPRDFLLTGVVEAIEPDDGLITIAHEDIPDLMPAMLMDFNPADPALLDDVFPGDEVEGTLRASYAPDGRLAQVDLIDLAVTRPATAPPPPAAPAVPLLKPGQPVPDFTLTGQDGEPFRLSDFRGRVVVLTFVYTRCPLPEFCPLMDRKFADLADRAGRTAERADRVRLLSVSFDPEHDTPEALAAHAARVGARPPLWRFAVASHEELARVAPLLGLAYAPLSGQIRHSLATAVVAPDGTLARLESGNSWRVDDLFAVVRGLAASAH